MVEGGHNGGLLEEEEKYFLFIMYISCRNHPLSFRYKAQIVCRLSSPGCWMNQEHNFNVEIKSFFCFTTNNSLPVRIFRRPK